MHGFFNKVFHGDALQLLGALPTESIDAVIADPMYGTAKNFRYEWGADPAQGDPIKHWLYHQPIYEECLRVLKPGGALAWAQGAKFCGEFHGWFGDYRIWSLARLGLETRTVSGPMGCTDAGADAHRSTACRPSGDLQQYGR